MADIKWHIGLSGFYYREWKGHFYPEKLPQRLWFDHYAQHFDTLEINSTFYRFPDHKMLENWYRKAPSSFTFSVKVPQIVTHRKRFRETETLLNDFYTVAAGGLQEKLGPVLFQLPPSMAYERALLERIIGQTDAAFKNVIEFRHPSWWRSEVVAALHASNIAFSGASYPGLPGEASTGLPLAYYRFHGIPKLYYSAYDESFIRQVAEQMAQGGTQEAYVYFNNTASGAAIGNAQTLQRLVAEGTAAAGNS